MAVVDAYLRDAPYLTDAGPDGRLLVTTTTTGLRAPSSTLSGYLWTVQRDPWAYDALPLTPTGARLRDPTLNLPPDVGYPAILATLSQALGALTLSSTGTTGGVAGGGSAYLVRRFARRGRRR